jgi:hypothetical protein
MAALAFTAYGVHWFALGWVRLGRTDPRPQVGMSIAFLIISILGIIVFFHAGDHPVGGLFIGLTGVYVGEFLANPAGDAPKLSAPGQRLLGIFHIGTGSWLMYLTFAVGPRRPSRADGRLSSVSAGTGPGLPAGVPPAV